ncbi:unnamed protein product [Rotaria magnacalcarata]|uniref:Uncharacterized protein n=1 Tax=Rotaria magnacalcarata TaxID=392030 RepID=A0A816Z1P3_9BILA|nr:unnamed protein product [Rotaria magnacalcarata]CAF4259599.1 unnamed protein product [Rotaria magnacalcarata]
MKQSQSQPKVCNIIEQKLLSPLAESLTFMECDSANQENQTISEPCPSATSDNLDSYTEHCLSETKSPEVLSNASVNELKSIKRSNLSKLHSSNHEIGLTDIELLDESLLNKSLNATFEVSPKSKKPVAKVSPTTSFSSQTSPMTIVAEINVLSTNVLNDTVTIPSEAVDGILLDKSHINEEMNVLCESYHSSQSSINSDKPIPFVVVSSSVEHVNSTFCVEDSTAPLDEGEYFNFCVEILMVL